MKVLLVTSALEKDTVERHAKESTVDTDVLALNVAVAAFLTPKTIIEALRKTGGIQVKAAGILGINQRSLWHRIKKLKIDVDSIRDLQ